MNCSRAACAAGAGAVHRVRRLDDVAAEQVFARRVDDVEEHGEQRRSASGSGPTKIMREAALRPPSGFVVGLLRRSARRARAVTRSTSRARTTQTTEDRRAPPISRRVGPDRSTTLPARTEPTHAPRLLPTPISGNSRLPCSWRVEVVGERPELRDHHQVEDADPEEVDDADVQAGASASRNSTRLRRRRTASPSARAARG